MTTFEIGDTDFLLDGEPHRILSGTIHYFRVHPDQWRDRVRKARLMGLNTIETYIAWNAHEPVRGRWDQTGALDVGGFLDIVADEGMHAIVRPGPYICAEWHNGGLPVWLTRMRDVRPRSSDPRYLEPVVDYLRRVYDIVTPRQIDRDGTVVLVQIENEYGAYGSDEAYLAELVRITREAGITVPLTTGKKWTPQNFDGESKGPIPLVDALAYSRNQATVRLGMDVGPDAVVRTLSQLGVKKTVPAYPSILLGSIGMTPFEVAMLYQPLATGGFATPLRSITDVLDKDGEPLARYPVDTEEVIDSGPAYLIQWGMQQVVEKGTARSARSVLPADLKVAGKTGTSDEYRDAWFAGFSGNHLSVVWVGRDNNENARVTGSSGALPVWSRLMAGLPQTSLSQVPPPGVEEVWMDPSGEKTSGKGCSGAREYPMLEASIPEQSDGCGNATQVKEGVVEWFKGWFD